MGKSRDTFELAALEQKTIGVRNVTSIARVQARTGVGMIHLSRYAPLNGADALVMRHSISHIEIYQHDLHGIGVALINHQN